jgi:hypothetical protein
MKRSHFLAASLASSSSSSNNASKSSRIFTVEWSPRVGQIHSQLLLPNVATHFVLPDLPQVYSDTDRAAFLTSVEPSLRIHTVAACRHETARSLLTSVSMVEPESTILLVGGNDKGRAGSLSTIEAANILRNERDNLLWGVANPNDPQSVHSVQEKVESGIRGILTQPLLSSSAFRTLQRYKENRLDDNDDGEGGNADDSLFPDPLLEPSTANNITLLPGLALPTSARSLQFWAKLMEQEDELSADPLFRSHLAYFSQPYATPLAWIGRELEGLLSPHADSFADGVHFMPLKNTDDLCTIFQSLARLH